MAKVLLRNESEVLAAMMPALEKAIDYVVQKIWNEHRELVRKIVYDVYEPVEYHRSGEFLNAWDTKTEKKGNKAIGTFKYAPDQMTHKAVGVHQSIYEPYEDSREFLAEIIYQGLAGAIGYSATSTKSGKHAGKKYAKNTEAFHDAAWANRRDAWSALIKYLGKTKVKKYFEEGLKQQGIKFIKLKGDIDIKKYDQK